jgi:hypothetical protein
MNLNIDINTLTLDELDELEEVMPEAVKALMNGKTTTKAMKGLAWLVQRREDPTFTMEDAGRLTLGSFIVDDPKDGNGHTTSPDSASSTESAPAS